MFNLPHPLTGTDGFRLRGTAMSRVDGFSDVVFGFALTLLVVSLEVPKTYTELHELMRGFLPFVISFTLLMTVWYAHYSFFRRFGLHDTATIVLNAALLFVVLFYVYPLKFLFGLFIGQLSGTLRESQIDAHQGAELMVIYGLGYAAIYILFAAMYWNGLRQRRRQDLNPLEEKLTKIYMVDHLVSAGIGLLSCLVAVLVPSNYVGNAGLVYMLLGISKTLTGIYAGRAGGITASPEVHARAPWISAEGSRSDSFTLRPHP